MRARSIGIRTLALLLLASLGFTLNSAAQNAEIAPGTERPMFTRFAGQLHSPRNAIEATATPLTTWNGSFVFSGTTYNYNMVGTAPSTGSSTTVQVKIIPIRIVITKTGD